MLLVLPVSYLSHALSSHFKILSWAWIWCSRLPSSCQWLPVGFHHCHSPAYLPITLEANYIQLFWFLLCSFRNKRLVYKTGLLVQCPTSNLGGRWITFRLISSSIATIPKIYLTLLRRSKAFHQRYNRFKILQHIKKSRKGFHPAPPPRPLLPR